jgi:carbonic anhydrase
MRSPRSLFVIGLILTAFVAVHAENADLSMTASDAMQSLKDGNDRFMTGKQLFPNLDPTRLQETATAQHPLAIVLACSDSRVPVEQIFDVGVGDIFVVRVAGNVAGPDEVGSIEYAAEHLKTPLLIVLGHTSCGAVTTATTGAELKGPLGALVARITPVTEKLAETTPSLTGKKLVAAAVKANVWQSIGDMFNQSPTVCELVKSGKLTVCGAIYHLADGSIDWIGEHPRQNQLITARLAKAEEPVTEDEKPTVSEKTETSPTIAAAATTPEPSKLSQAMDKLESTMKGNPAASNKAATTQAVPAAATAQPANMASQADLSQMAIIKQELEQLRVQVVKLESSSATRQFTESTLTALTTELEYAKAQISSLQGANEQTSKKLASLDDDGMAPTTTSNGDMDRLASLVTELNTSLEKTKAAGAQQSQNITTVKHGSVILTGLVHQQYYNRFGTMKSSTFDSKRARLGITGTMNSYAKIDVVGEFAKTPKLLDGMVTITPNKYWSAKVGQFKAPFSTDLMRPISAMPFVNASLMTGLGPDRDIGATVGYENKNDKMFTYNVVAGIFNGSGINASDANTDKNPLVRVETKVMDMLTFAPNLYLGKTNDTGAAKKSFTSWGASATWSWKRETVEAEFIKSKVGDVNKDGWAVWGGHMFSTGMKFLQEIQACVRYEQYDPSRSAINDKQTRLSVGANLFVDKKYTMFQLNYQFNGEEGTKVSNDDFLANFQVTF